MLSVVKLFMNVAYKFTYMIKVNVHNTISILQQLHSSRGHLPVPFHHFTQLKKTGIDERKHAKLQKQKRFRNEHFSCHIYLNVHVTYCKTSDRNC